MLEIYLRIFLAFGMAPERWVAEEVGHVLEEPAADAAVVILGLEEASEAEAEEQHDEDVPEELVEAEAVEPYPLIYAEADLNINHPHPTVHRLLRPPFSEAGEH